ncbi:MAG: hypothetical protein ACOCX2_11060 [Armatimonadota bacterium]
MSRKTASQRQPGSTPRVSPAGRVWSEVIWPALIIGLIGVGAVVYVFACARISIIECDLRRLERAREAQQAARCELQQQLATMQNAQRIQEHIEEEELDRPTGTRRVHLTDVPPALYEVLPTTGSDHDHREIRLGELSDESSDPLHADGRQIASARIQ